MSLTENHANGTTPATWQDEVELGAAQILKDRKKFERANELEESQPVDLPVVVSGKWLREQVFAPVRWAVPLVVPQGLTLVSGAPKAGKSFLVLSWALAIATGASAAGFERRPARPVLYLALEDGYPRLQSRSVDLFGQVPDEISFVVKATPAQGRALCVTFLDRCPDGVVFIDMLSKIRPPKLPGEAAYDHDQRSLGAYQEIATARPGTAIVIVHHTRKDKSGDFVDAINGTYGVSGAIDTAVVLYRDRKTSDGKLMVTGRDVEEDEFLLSGFPYWKLAGGSPASARMAAEQYDARANVGDRSFQILSKIDEQGRITTAEAAQLLGLTSSQAATYLGRLADTGKIRKDGRGLYVSSVGSVGSVALYPSESHKATDTTPDTYARGFDLQKLWEMSKF